MRAEEFRARDLFKPILTEVTNNTGNLQHNRTRLTAASASQSKLSANRIFVGPIALRHRLVDDRDPQRTAGVELVEQPAAQQSCTDGMEVSGCRDRVLCNRFLTGWNRRPAIDSHRNRRH